MVMSNRSAVWLTTAVNSRACTLRQGVRALTEKWRGTATTVEVPSVQRCKSSRPCATCTSNTLLTIVTTPAASPLCKVREVVT